MGLLGPGTDGGLPMACHCAPGGKMLGFSAFPKRNVSGGLL
jgi:hypothetical protein